MPKQDAPLQVEIPRPGADHPAWSRVGIIALIGFAVGVAWPKLAGVKLGPSVPSDLRAQVEGTATPKPPASTSAAALAASGAPVASGAPSAAAIAGDDPAPAVAPNQELVVIGPGKITKCYEKKDKKVEDCGKLQFDPIALKKLAELSKCPSALGLSGKMTLGFEVNFDKKEVQVVKQKKGTSLPSTTVNGILQCAAKEFGNVELDEVPHKYRKYSLAYTLNFYPPGKHPENPDAAAAGDGDGAAGATTNETEASGTATVTADAAPLRKEPKGGEKIGRLVRGAKVKIVGRQNDWYKVEAGSKVGWVYRGAIGL